MKAVAILSPVAPARGVVAMGVLGGVTVTALECLRLQSTIAPPELLQVAAKILPQWTVAGIAIGGLAVLAERRLRGGAIALALVALAVAASAVFAGLRALLARFVAPAALAVFDGEDLGWPTFLYDLWVMLVFGGLFLIACVLQLRSERTRHVLAQAAIERARTETLLGEAQLRSLQASVNPAFLLRVMNEVSRRYEGGGPGADRLLDALVVFLRRAMPGVREAGSTLADELALASAYAKVWEELDATRPRWRIRADATVPRIPFPALVLLPVLDRWASAVPPGSTAELRAQAHGDVATITLDDESGAAAGWIGPELEFRLRVALRAVFGDRFGLATVRRGGLASSALSVSIPGEAAPAPAPRDRQREADGRPAA